jgi:hypothetical protein
MFAMVPPQFDFHLVLESATILLAPALPSGQARRKKILLSNGGFRKTTARPLAGHHG